MSAHPSFEALSALFDGEESSEETRRHAADCPACLLTLKSFEEERRALRGAWTVSPAGEPFLAALADAVRERPSVLRMLADQMRESLRGPAPVAATAAACLALLFWARSSGLFGIRVEIPEELFVAAHNQYELTLPLAPKERILTEMPRGLAAGFDAAAPRGSGVY
ncbi:MAG: hypothetical protein AUJ52_01155 [Elusimicrobia bacterium CG1_02_63_36]|nr:MAG: hypothetical protein AUJ52_01155 [Elusimicrobia bacterium CG1_02_63_36]PIP84366.1 MAG: hypothetical protein COR54_04165 [Elusimicrobia bacterium CG22_combo_CG10-13_8_21_14_all_63_91]PJA18619.1 MAG: hypothetical protein COX66_00435 [Elusimicrobia bacterium CG_4_10_14_0_2_um_filter_63_34]PJB23363.1 MAG: hypothetical protein CO113_18150 [Elusimicrobia bacterium CG_4_9_14_3_um_filter_62_55]